MKWNYDDFYDFYVKSLQKNKKKPLSVCFYEFQKVNKKTTQVEIFCHDASDIDISKLKDMVSIDEYHDTFPLGLYIMQSRKDAQHENKRIFFVFPSQKVLDNNTKKTSVIADHFTFLINSKNEMDKRPVKSHVTIYTPSGVILDDNRSGTVDQRNFYLPKTFHTSKVAQYIKLKHKPYTECLIELLHKPIQEKKEGGGLPLRKTKLSNQKKQYASKQLQTLMNKYSITNMFVIGIKTNAQNRMYDYTAIVETDIPEMMETDDDQDLPAAASFTFSSSINTFSKLQQKLISLMETWEDRYFSMITLSSA